MHLPYVLLTLMIVAFISFVSCDDDKIALRQGDENPPVPDEQETVPVVPVTTPPPVVEEEGEESQDDPLEIKDPSAYVSYVALIDIVFQDGSKRTCSGAIVHDNVIITAAHCFTLGYQKDVQVEMTSSFIVIGSKIMFEGGYEQYLPIEKILTHPNYTGWTSDLALVYTYAGLASDRPGRIVPLAGEAGQTPVDSNVTVLSWGKCRDTSNDNKDSNGSEEGGGESGNDDGKEQKKQKCKMTKAPPGSKETFKDEDCDDSDENWKSNLRAKNNKQRVVRKQLFVSNPGAAATPQKRPHAPPRADRSHRFHVQAMRMRDGQLLTNVEETTSRSTVTEFRPRRTSYSIYKALDTARQAQAENLERRPDAETDDGWVRRKRSHAHPKGTWRRHMTPHKNNLTIQVFHFVNSLACMKLIDKSMPDVFSIKNKNEVLCYTSDEHYVTVEDSGAPALQQGMLVAVTVGGTEWEGEHVAVGMKMSCYCTWIAENLPNTGEKIKCCTDCCEEASNSKTSKRKSHKNNANANELHGDSVKRFNDGDDLGDPLSEPDTPSVFRSANKNK